MIPTFIGATLLVFVILQLAPDGPFERAVKELKESGGSSESGSSGSVVSSQNLTPELLDELRMQFGLDKPIIIRYLIWLGIYNLLGLPFVWRYLGFFFPLLSMSLPFS